MSGVVVTLIENGPAILGALKTGAGLIRSFFPDKTKDLQDVTYRVYEDEQPKGKVRVILVNESNGWNKAIRLYHGGSGYSECKAGDSTGTVAKGDPHLKYSIQTIDFPWKSGGQQYIALQLWKPKALGIWYDLEEIRITPSNQSDYDVRIYHGGSNYDECKAGDSISTVSKGDPHLKYSIQTIDFPWKSGGQQYIALQLWKPKALGIWYDLEEIRITPSNQSDYDGKTLVFYWGTDSSTYFHDPNHLIKPYELFKIPI